MTTCWRLDDGHQTIVLAVINDHLPQTVYWGPTLPDGEDLPTLADAHLIDLTGGMMDAIAPISVCPAVADTFHGHPGMELRIDGAPAYPEFKVVNVVHTPDDVMGHSIRFECRDTALNLNLVVGFSFTNLHGSGQVLTAETTLITHTDIDLFWLAAPVLPAPQLADTVHTFSGKWTKEFQLNDVTWAPGQHMREARLGRSGHEHPPVAIFPEVGTTNTRGASYAMHFGWSGGHKMLAEELPDGRRQVQWGKLPGSLHPTIGSDGRKFYTSGPVHATYHDQGLNGAATTFQRFFRDGLSRPVKTPRPVHYNCWEAIYFDHDLADLCAIADHAADLGAERFVLDDGWFGRRDDDTTSLGDWQIDRRKWPDGLTPLIDHVKSKGMDFGLWFEPEMISGDSDLYRAHPDWILGDADQTLGRQQFVLDMRRVEVRDYLFDAIDAILRDHDIAYIKWDHNRLPPITDARQTDGIYSLLSRLNIAHPHLEIESCASGGGRIDAGILRHTHRVWLSDSNDAMERQRIQHDAALFLPSIITGSHVGPRHCHTSGRVFDMNYRAWVAAQRHMGFEMDPRELTSDEAATLRHVTRWYKDNRDWMATADILRLDTIDPAIIAEQQLSADGSRFVVFSGQVDTSDQISPRPLRLTQLDQAAQYQVALTNRDQVVDLSRGAPALKTTDITASGTWLMAHGILLPWAFPGTMWVLEGHKL